MQIKETIGLSFTGSVESPPLEDVVVLVDSAGVALGVQRAGSARVRGVCNGDSGLIASRCVEIPVVGSDGEVSGILYHNDLPPDTHGAVPSGERESEREIADMAQFVVHDINNLLAVIGSGLRLLECQSDAGRQKAIVGKMQEAITRGALLIRQLLDGARPQPTSIDGFVAGSRLVAIAGTLDRTLRPDITIRTEIAPELWAFNADPEELYFALLNLCRNSADAMPDGGVITVAARNVEPSSGVTRGLVEIVVADDGEGMPEEVLSQALNPYFTTKPAGSGTGLGLPQVQRFAEERGGAVCIESVRGIGTLVRLFLPRVQATGLPISIVGT
jgi:signal transduction histidine kinase